MFKKFTVEILEAQTVEEFYRIDNEAYRMYQREKLSWEDLALLDKLMNRMMDLMGKMSLAERLTDVLERQDSFTEMEMAQELGLIHEDMLQSLRDILEYLELLKTMP